MNLTLGGEIVIEWPAPLLNRTSWQIEYDVTTHVGPLLWSLTEGALVIEVYRTGTTRAQMEEPNLLPTGTHVYPLTSVRRFRIEPYISGVPA